MSTELAVIISMTIYKLSCLAMGSLFCVLGYRLFRAGVRGDAGNVEAKFDDTKIVLKAAAPGTFFAILGAAIVVTTLWHGLDYDLQRAVDMAKPPLP